MERAIHKVINVRKKLIFLDNITINSASRNDKRSHFCITETAFPPRNKYKREDYAYRNQEL